MSEDTINTTLFTESPTSWNTRYVTEDGYTCQLTLRAESGKDLLERANSALDYLREQGCIPFYGYSRGNGNQHNDNSANGNSNNMCPIHNVELHVGHGGQIARGAGSHVQLMAKEGKYAFIKLPSGEVRMVSLECKATIGQVGNLEHENQSDGKAGRRRWRGRRPHVRGVAMNPVDHPHGGGEGKSSGGRHPVTPWGVPTKGYKTRVKKASDKLIVKKRS